MRYQSRMMHGMPSQETLYTIGGICIVCGTGLFQLRKERRRLETRRAFATEFRSRFHAYASNPEQEFHTYTWLIANSPQKWRWEVWERIRISPMAGIHIQITPLS
ncbi:MAG: hypothetical protein WA709_36245 [Stellaceae bacterium]